MNKYELALVVSAKLEDEARDAVVEKAKSYITRYKASTILFSLKQILSARRRSRDMSASWTMY